MSFDPQVPFDQLPELPPSVDIESKLILKACIDARAALAGLKSAGDLIPNQSVLINTIPILEAKASSEIENIVTTTDALFRYSQSEDQAKDPATKEALRYRTALYRGFVGLKDRPLSTNTAIEVCSHLKDTEMRLRRIPGTALANSSTREIIYTPPVGEEVLRKKLANWESFIHDGPDVDPLIKMAVAHYQFEAIHPFTDGNGRTGRVLNLLMMVEKGLLTQPVLYLSRYILGHRADYYKKLLAVTVEKEWEPWIKFMLDAVTETAGWTTRKIQAIQEQHVMAVDFMRKNAPKIYSRELVDILFSQPYCRIANLGDAGVAKRQTAASYLKKLVSIGMLQEVDTGREKLFVHPNFVRLLSSDSHLVTSYEAP